METALTENAKTVIERRIAERDEEGNAKETAEQVFQRVAENVALADLAYYSDDMSEDDKTDAYAKTVEKFLGLLSRLDFLPNSPTLVNAGRDLQQLSACFVIPVEDSMEGIFEAVKQAALIHKTGGGTGFSFSRLRGKSSTVSSTSGIASGPVSFMQVFDKATSVIKQGGTRRGANMGILRVDHPDILEFIKMKDDNVSMSNFNISVAITDEFMEAFIGKGQYNLLRPGTGESAGRLNASDVWDAITAGAHKTGDPGLVFIDRINGGTANPVPSRGPIESTNPCGEQPLYAWDSCNLGSINLANFVKDGKVDYPRLSDVVRESVHFLDNVIDMNRWPNEQIKEVSLAIRRIGLGVMGWADMLIKLGIRYGSDESLLLGETLMAFVSDQASQSSQMLGLKRGAFPDIGKSIYAESSKLRNSTRTTIAPTGTISIIAGVSSGIEPVFAFEYTRSHHLDKDPDKRYEMKEYHPLLKEWKDKNPGKELPDYFVSAHDIDPGMHIAMQAVFQRNTDNAVSKTINLPHTATVEDVDQAYKMAWLTGCLGITVYRDGSKDNQVLSIGTKKESTVTAPVAGTRKRLNDTRDAVIHSADIGTHRLYLQVGAYEDGAPGEIFIVANKSGSTTRGYLDTIGGLSSLCLQYGVPIDDVADKLIGTKFEPSGFTSNADIKVVSSPLDYIGRWLKGRFNTEQPIEEGVKEASGELCPDCDGTLYAAEGCYTCNSCGYSKCG